MQCPSCGRSNPGEFLFCLNCGTIFSLYEAGQYELSSSATLGIELYKRCPLCNRNIPEQYPFCVNCGTVTDNVQAFQNLPPSSVIRWNAEETRAQASPEVVNIPSGVTVTLKRSRTVEHTIEVEWHTSLEVGLEAGIKELVSASIHSEIERAQGHAYKQSETVEYEIRLDGNKNSHYKLIWTDVWRTGTVEVKSGVTRYSLPFKFRMRTELDVVPFQ